MNDVTVPCLHDLRTSFVTWKTRLSLPAKGITKDHSSQNARVPVSVGGVMDLKMGVSSGESLRAIKGKTKLLYFVIRNFCLFCFAFLFLEIRGFIE